MLHKYGVCEKHLIIAIEKKIWMLNHAHTSFVNYVLHNVFKNDTKVLISALDEGEVGSGGGDVS